MSEIQRWDGRRTPSRNPRGEWVLYAEHKAAIAAAEQIAEARGVAVGLLEGAEEERARIRTGVLAYYQVAPKAAEPILAIIDPPTSSTDAVSSYPPPRVPPTSVAPAGEDHGAPDGPRRPAIGGHA